MPRMFALVKGGLIFVFYCLLAMPAGAQYWMQFGGSTTIDEASDVATDASDNAYATGYFTTIANFSSLSVTSSGLDDIFLYKTNALGVPQWLKRAGGAGSDKGMAVSTNLTGDVVITGFFSGSAQFETQTVTSSGLQDIFVAKYTSTGTLAWVKKAGGTGYDAGYGITCDRSGNVIVTGEFSGSCTFGAVTLTSNAGSTDVFTVKYDPSGNVLWAEQGGGPGTDKGYEVAADSTGRIYVSGLISDTVTFDFTHNNSFSNAIFLLQYNTAGQEQWFRWMGSSTTSLLGGMDVKGPNISLTGDLTGSMFFFGGTGSPMLAGPGAYNVFVCRYDTAGNYAWSAASGSSSNVSATGIATRNNGNTVITGNFKCRFSDYSALYGDGVMCSAGYWDCYVSSYDNLGSLLWARSFGGNNDDLSYSVCLRSDTLAVTAGSFEGKLVSTVAPATYLGYGTSNITETGAYCTDNDYFRYVTKNSAGNKDVFINNNIDLLREPFDFFYRGGSSCVRTFNDVCINRTGVNSLTCSDTVAGCSATQIYASTNSLFNRDPSWNFIWNTGSPINTTIANASGTYSVTVTSPDGCFSNTDSVYFDLQSPPPTPTISDDHLINVNAPGPAPIELCYPDSVVLTCTNVGSYTVAWSTFPLGQNPVQVNASASLNCTLTSPAGCSSSTGVTVDIFPPMQPIVPGLICLEDTLDRNDTIDICDGDFFTIFPFDTISNPLHSTDSCIQQLTHVAWDTAGLSQFLFFSPTTSCGALANTFVPNQTGNFDFVINAMVIRETVCDSDTVVVSYPLHVNVNPVPTINNFPINISSSGTVVCPGDSLLLVASGSTNYHWIGPSGPGIISLDDSVYVHFPGTYIVKSDSTITNSFGCSAELHTSNSITITTYPQPTLSMTPADGIACPNDSVLLSCTGPGSFTWYGPGGSFAGDSTQYVTVPGTYYAVVTAGGCGLVSNTVQVIPYNNPIIIAFPAPSLCENNNVQLTVASNLGSSITWHPPLSGSAATQVVNDTGTYTCTVVSCGITSQLSFTVFRDSANAEITAGATDFCSGDSVLLTANAGMDRYLWLPSGDTLLNTYASAGGTDTLITTSLHGCKDTATVFVNEIPNLLLPPLVTDTGACYGKPAEAFAVSSDTVFWTYSLSYADTFHTGTSYFVPSVTASQTYYVYTRNGLCKSEFDTVQVLLDPCHDLVLSNVITPDGNSMNDYFPEPGNNYLFDLTIFNRWGKVVYEVEQSNEGWNGKTSGGDVVPDGTYYYVLDVTFFDNTIQNFKGSLMVMGGK